MRRLFLSFLVLTLTLPAIAQAKHPFTFEDMMKLKRVGDPQVSPDGKWVIFSVVDVDLAANTKTPHVWIVPLNADSHVSQNHGDMGHPDSTERELMPEQDADRPRWSPDGKRFAFLSNKTNGSQVWIADFDPETGKVVGKSQLTTTVTEAGGELWSPDGKSILFTSEVYPQCDGLPNEIACNFTKHAEENRSKVKAQIFDHLLYRHWNAYKEGTRTHLFLANIRSAGNPKCVNVPDQPCSNRQYFATAYRDLTPGDYDAPVFSLGGQDDYAFSPDGQEICYASNHDKNPAASTNNDLWIVPVDGGADASSGPTSDAARELTPHDWVKTVLAHTKNITADNPASDTSPLYSPDGKYIAYRAQQRPGYESDRFRLVLYDRKTGTTANATEEFDHWVGTFTWAPDSKRLYFSAEDTGEAPIYALSFEATGKNLESRSKITEIARGFNDDLAVTADGLAIVFTRMSIGAPTEVYVNRYTPVGPASDCKATFPYKGLTVVQFDCSTRLDLQRLSHLNDSLLSNVAMSPLESFWFSGAHNDKVQGFLVKPPNFDASKKYPVKFLIHGGPQGAWGDDWSYRWNPELLASPTSATPSGYVVIMINFHGSTGYGQKFIDAINGDWGGAPYEDLMKGLDYAEQTYPFIDKNRECALGASYGGYAINWILGHTDRFKCLVSHDGMFNAESAWGTTEELWFNDWEFKGTPYDNRASYQQWSPHQYAKNFKTPTLVIHGQRDYRLDVSEGLQLFTTLQMEGVPSKMLYFPDEGHWVLKPQNSQLWYKTVNDWVDQWTK
ncbi:MAG TPA: S9 family peptidase [Candidatus Solibacter sp.]|nr:S9 family peptidase [Candidatus Solibacter sp.]